MPDQRWPPAAAPKIMKHTFRIAPAAVALLALGACGGRDDLDGRRREIPGLTEADREVAAAPDEIVHYDFYDNRASAIVIAGGTLIVEPAGPILAKFIDGGLGASWQTGEDGGRRVALPAGITAPLWLPIDFDDGGVARNRDGTIGFHISARAPRPGQLMSLLIGERRIADVAIAESAFTSSRIDIPADAVAPGELALRLFFRHTGALAGVETGAAIARIGLGPGPLPDRPVLTAGPVARGGERMPALQLAASARTSFYMELPAGSPMMTFGASAAPDVSLTVRVAADEAAAHPVWTGKGSAGWTTASVDLRPWAGRAVRIDLAASGPADWGRPRIVTRATPATAKPLAPADHVIVWSISSLRADRVDPTSARAPALARFALRGAWLDATTTAAASGPAHVALMSGRRTGAGAIPDHARTLAERFREAGFATALVSGNGFVSDDRGFSRGFDIYENPMRRRTPHGAHTLWQSARKVLLPRIDQHVFLFVATSEPHLPYTPSPTSLAAEWPPTSPVPAAIEPARTADLAAASQAGTLALPADAKAYLRALYDASIRDADAAFGEMLDDLEELGIADRTAIVVVGDVGQELFERGSFGHGHQIHRETSLVPLLIVAPGLPASRPQGVRPSLVDVYPTVLALAGITSNPEIHGESLLPWLLGPQPGELTPAITQLPGRARAIEMAGHRLLVPVREPIELYDLTADPTERTNVAATHPITVRTLRNVMGIAAAYENSWSRRRWGSERAVSEAFASDHGL